MTGPSRRDLTLLLAGLAAIPARVRAQLAGDDRAAEARLPTGVRLRYIAQGTGAAVVFVHGSLSDYTYWTDQVAAFSAHGRAIAYSRRHDWPNANPIRPGYSAVVDAEDLAAFIETLNLGKAVIVGHSHGALAALFLATRRPDLVKALVLAEAPAVSLLNHVSGVRAAAGRAAHDDIARRMVAPMAQAFGRGDREAGVAAFLAYVLGDPQAWAKMPAESKLATRRNLPEWEAIFAGGDLFPVIAPEAVRRIAAPTLLISGGRSYAFMKLIDEAQMQRIPGARQLVLPAATHQMWRQEPVACRDAVVGLMARA
jgi:non-heme chloroperoxidase